MHHVASSTAYMYVSSTVCIVVYAFVWYRYVCDVCALMARHSSGVNNANVVYFLLHLVLIHQLITTATTGTTPTKVENAAITRTRTTL